MGEEGVLVAFVDTEGGARVVAGDSHLPGAAQRQAPSVDETARKGTETGREGGADSLGVVDDQAEPVGVDEVPHPRHEVPFVPGLRDQRLGQEVVAAVLSDVDAGVRRDVGSRGMSPVVMPVNRRSVVLVVVWPGKVSVRKVRSGGQGEGFIGIS